MNEPYSTSYKNFGEGEIYSDLSELKPEEIDAMVRNGQVELRSIAYGYETNFSDRELPGGWKCKWINTQGMGNHWTLILLPTNQRTYHIYQEYMIQKWKNAWLGEEHAKTWAKSKVPYKHELLYDLVQILEDNYLKEAYLRNTEWVTGRRRTRWQTENHIPENLKSLSHPRELSLIALVKECERVTIDKIKKSVQGWIFSIEQRWHMKK